MSLEENFIQPMPKPIGSDLICHPIKPNTFRKRLKATQNHQSCVKLSFMTQSTEFSWHQINEQHFMPDSYKPPYASHKYFIRIRAKKRKGNTCCVSILVRFFHKILGAQNDVYSSSMGETLEAYNKLTRFQHEKITK